MATTQNVNPKNIKNKMSERFVEVKSFYNKHFPTDRKTYNWRISFVGLLLSMLALHFVTSNFVVRWFFRDDTNFWLRYVYIFAAAVVGYELHYGLEIGDRKQYTPWILLKIVEICLIVSTVIYILADKWWRLRFEVANLIYGLIILALNSFITYVITSTSIKQFRGSPPSNAKVDEYIYETYEPV